MLPKQNRLHLRTEFKRIKEKGKLFQGRLFSLLVVDQHPTDRPPRFAFIVSKRIHQRATKRNHLRRLLSENVHQLLPQICLGTEGVFLAKKAIFGKGLLEIKKEVEEIFRKAKLLSR